MFPLLRDIPKKMLVMKNFIHVINVGASGVARREFIIFLNRKAQRVMQNEKKM